MMHGQFKRLPALLIALATLSVGTALASSTSTSQYLQQLQADQTATQSTVNTATTGSQNLDISLSGLSGYTTITQPLAWSPSTLPGVLDSSGQTAPNYPIGTTPTLASQLMGQQFGGKRAVCLSGDTGYGPPYYGGHVGSAYCGGDTAHWEYSQAQVQALTNGNVQLKLLFDYTWHTVDFPIDQPFSYQVTNGGLGVRFVYQGAVNGTMELQQMKYGDRLVNNSWQRTWLYNTMAYANFQISQTPYGHYWYYASSCNSFTSSCSLTENTVSG